MADLNKVILMGHITADPELKQTQSGTSVCSFSIGVNRRYSKDQAQQGVDFINIVAWRQQAEFVTRYFKKGSSIIVCGSLQTRNLTDQNGQKRYATEVVADEVSFGGGKEVQSAEGKVQSEETKPYMPNAYTQYPTDNRASTQDIPGDEQLPF